MSTSLRLWRYEDECEAELFLWEAQLVLLKIKAAQADGAVQRACCTSLQTLQRKQEDMKVKHLELRIARKEAWDELRDAMEKARMDLRIAFCNVAAKLG